MFPGYIIAGAVYLILLPYFVLFIAGISFGYGLIDTGLFALVATLLLLLFVVLYKAAVDIYGTVCHTYRRNKRSDYPKRKKRKSQRKGEEL